MSAVHFQSQPDEILRRLGNQVVPVDSPVNVEQRREQVIAALSRSIRESSERKRRTQRMRLVWGLGLAASLALGVGFASRVRQSALNDGLRATTVSDLRGAVVVTESGESRVLSHGGKVSLRAFSEIETAPEAQAEILTQRSQVRLGSATRLTVPPATPVEERYRLLLGKVDVSVERHSNVVRSVVVETPHAEVVVHGTVFAVGVSSHSDHLVTEVSVTRGSVWVLANGVQVALLGPGQHWSSDGPVAGVSGVRAVPAPVDSVAVHEPAAPVLRRETAVVQPNASTLIEQGHMFQDAIDARNRGDDVKAAELFARLFARYPNYEEAEVQLFRAQHRLGRTAAAAAEARRYLAQHPQGFAREEARALALGSTPQR